MKIIDNIQIDTQNLVYEENGKEHVVATNEQVNELKESIGRNVDGIARLGTDKQDKLTAGNGISIVGNTISSTQTKFYDGVNVTIDTAYTNHIMYSFVGVVNSFIIHKADGQQEKKEGPFSGVYLVSSKKTNNYNGYAIYFDGSPMQILLGISAIQKIVLDSAEGAMTINFD